MATDLFAEVEPELVVGEAGGAPVVVDAPVHVLQAQHVADLGNQHLESEKMGEGTCVEISGEKNNVSFYFSFFSGRWAFLHLSRGEKGGDGHDNRKPELGKKK